MDREVINPSVVYVVLLYGPKNDKYIGFPKKALPYKSIILNDLDGSKRE